jgi:type II secretory pathway pseudopilin PulG
MRDRRATYRIRSGFSLVEVVIAIGLFSFVVVGIIGMFSIGLRQQGNWANNFSAVYATQQVMAYIDSKTNLADAAPILSNIPTTNVFGLSASWDTNAINANVTNSTNFSAFDSSKWDTGVSEDGIVSLVRVISRPLGAGLYEIQIDVAYPAAAPSSNRQVETFSTLVNKP